MDAQHLARLRVLLQNYPTVWHAGRSVELTLYKGWGGKEDYLGAMVNERLAELTVLCHEYAREQLLGESDG